MFFFSYILQGKNQTYKRTSSAKLAVNYLRKKIVFKQSGTNDGFAFRHTAFEAEAGSTL